MMRWFSAILLVPLFLFVAYAALWGGLALWFKLPGPELLRGLVSCVFGLMGLGTLVSVFHASRWRWLAGFGVVFALVLVWWNTLEPPREDNWSPEVARQVTGTIEGDTLTLQNARDFSWRSADDVTERWVTRSYDLSRIESVDLFMSYWGGPTMAHLMLSFGFEDGEFLVWSFEVRRSEGETFSPVADFFKANSLSLVAGTERDIVGLRSNIQQSEVFLFRLRSDPEARRRLLEGYVNRANALAQDPAFFNSVFTNCSKTVVDLARSLGAPLPADWRVIVNGYFPDYLYDLGAMTDGLSLDDIRDAGNITQNARSFGLREGFAKAIRKDVPAP